MRALSKQVARKVGRNLKQVGARVGANVIETALPQQSQIGLLQHLAGVVLRWQQPDQVAVQSQPVQLEQLARELTFRRRQRRAKARGFGRLVPVLVIVGLRHRAHAEFARSVDYND